MNRNLILLCRLGGMLIEIVCLIGLLQLKSRTAPSANGVTLQTILWFGFVAGLVAGFVLWLIGTIAQMRIARIPARHHREQP